MGLKAESDVEPLAVVEDFDPLDDGGACLGGLLPLAGVAHEPGDAVPS